MKSIQTYMTIDTRPPDY